MSKKSISGSVYKASNYKQKPSKEKHVRAIILRSFVNDAAREDVIKSLQQRMEKQNWAVVIKCLMIFHRLYRDVDAAIMDLMKSRSGQVFALSRFTATAPSQHMYTLFVKNMRNILKKNVQFIAYLGISSKKIRQVSKK